MKRRILWIVVDVAAAVLMLFGVWGINYLIPQKGISAVPMSPYSYLIISTIRGNWISPIPGNM